MKPILYEADETQFTTNGVCRVSDCISCEVTEVRNGMFEVEMVYPVNGLYFNEIKSGRILYCYHDASKTPQAFDIYDVSKPNRGNIKVKARHISYRLSGIVSTPIGVADLPPQDFFDLMMSETVGVNPFLFYSDISTLGSLIYDEPKTLRSMLGDDENSVIGVWDNGEFRWDMWSVFFTENRGIDRGVKIRRGKNVKLLTVESDASEIVTGIIPWWLGPSDATGDDVYVELPEKIIYSPDASNYPYQKTKPLDMSDVWETEPTVADLRAGATEWLARNYANTRNRDTYVVDLVTENDDITDLNNVLLCDYVTVQDPILNLDRTLKVVKVVYDVIREKYVKMEIGDTRRTLAYDFKLTTSNLKRRIENTETKTAAIAKSASAAGTEAHVEQQLQDSNSALVQAIEKPATTQTVGAVKVGSGLSITPDGTLSATGGSGGDSEWGGRNDEYGTASLYANRSGSTPSARTTPKWTINNTGFNIPEWSKTEYGLFGPQWNIQYNNSEIGIFDACAYKQTSGTASEQGVHSKTRFGKGIIQIDQFKRTNDTDWTNNVKIGHSENRSDTQTDYNTTKSTTDMYGKTNLHDVVSLQQDLKYNNRKVNGMRLPGSGGSLGTGCLFFDSVVYPPRLVFATCDEDGNVAPFQYAGSGQKFIWYTEFTYEQVT